MYTPYFRTYPPIISDMYIPISEQIPLSQVMYNPYFAQVWNVHPYFRTHISDRMCTPYFRTRIPYQKW